MFKFILAISICISFISCTQQKKEAVEYSNTKILSINEMDDGFETLIKDIKFIALENIENSVFSNIDKILFRNDNIYILDASSAHQVFVFNMEGDFMQRIGKKGRGPGEYLMLCDFDVLENGDVLLYDRQQKRLLTYDEKGNYVKEQKLPFRADGFNLLKNNKYIFSVLKEGINDGTKNHKVIVTDENFNISKMYFEYDEHCLDNKGNSHIFRETIKGLVYNKPVNDSIFLFDYDGNIKEAYFVNYNNRTVPQELKNDYAKLLESRRDHDWMYFYQTPMLLGGKYLLANVFKGGNKGFLILDIMNGKSYFNQINIDSLRLSNLNYALTTLGDSSIVSYLDFDLYHYANDKEVLSKDIKEHLEGGGYALVIYSS